MSEIFDDGWSDDLPKTDNEHIVKYPRIMKRILKILTATILTLIVLFIYLLFLGGAMQGIVWAMYAFIGLNIAILILITWSGWSAIIDD